MSLKKNLVSNLILTASTIIFPLITLPYITRTLSASNIGKVFFVDSFTQYFILFSAIGIPFYGVREIAKIKGNREKVSSLVVDLVITQISLAFLSCIILYIMYLFFPKLNSESGLITIACLAIISNSFLIEWFYQGIENFTYITKRSLVIKTISVILILILIKQNTDYQIYYLILTLTVLANAILNFVNFFRKSYTPYVFHRGIFKHLKPLWVLFSINIAISLYTIMDTIILGSLTSPQDVSFYNIPLKIVKIFWTIMAGIGVVLIPRMSSFFANNEVDRIQELMKKSISIVVMLGLPFLFLALIFPTEILLAVSGNQYLKAKMALQVLGVVPFIIGICNVFGTQYLLAIGQERKILYGTILGFAVSLGLNFLLIPKIGFLGASISCVMAELSVCVTVYYFARKTIKIIIDYQLIMLVILSLCITILFWLGIQHLISSFYLLGSCIVTYAITFLILNYFFFRNSLVASILNFFSNKKITI